jgi:hypothetical protein
LWAKKPEGEMESALRHKLQGHDINIKMQKYKYVGKCGQPSVPLSVGSNGGTVQIVGSNGRTVQIVGSNGGTVQIVGSNGGTVQIVGSNGGTVQIVGSNGGNVQIVGSNGRTVQIVGSNGGTVQISAGQQIYRLLWETYFHDSVYLRIFVPSVTNYLK